MVLLTLIQIWTKKQLTQSVPKELEVILDINVYIYTSTDSLEYYMTGNYLSEGFTSYTWILYQTLWSHSIFILISSTMVFFCSFYFVDDFKIYLLNDNCYQRNLSNMNTFPQGFGLISALFTHGFSLFRSSGFGWHSRGSFYPGFDFS